MLCERQLVSSRIWTRVVVSISYDDNHYTTGTLWTSKETWDQFTLVDKKVMIKIWLKSLAVPFAIIFRLGSSRSNMLEFGLVWFYSTSIIVGYLVPNTFYRYKVLFQTIQFSISTLVLFDLYIGPYLVLQPRVDLGAMTMKGYSAFFKAPALLESHHQIV